MSLRKCNANIAVSANQWCHVRRHDSWAVCTAGQFPRSAQVCILCEESGSVCLPNDWSASRLCSQDLGSASTFCLEKVAGTNDDICWVWRVADDEHLSICYWKNFKEIKLQLRSASCWVSPTAPMEFLICSNYLIPLVIILLPVVPHKAVAEVSKIVNLQERLVVVNHGQQSESTYGPTGGWSCVFWMVAMVAVATLPQLLDVVWRSASVVVIAVVV